MCFSTITWESFYFRLAGLMNPGLHSKAIGLLLLLAASVGAHGEEFTIYGALTTDYVFRGISNSDQHGAVQIGLDLKIDAGFFAGLWASTIDITTGNRNRSLEVDYYLGYVWFFDDDWSVAVSANRYTYPGAEGAVNYNYNELGVVIGIHDRLWFEFDYTDSLFGHDEPAYNAEVLASWPLPAELSLSIGIGYFDVHRFAGSGYSYWQMGVSRPLGWSSFDLRYHDSNGVPALISQKNLADQRVVLTISAAF